MITGQERSKPLRLTIELTSAQACGLKRFVHKSGALEARAVLYPHIRQAIRDDQVRDIIAALAVLERALDEADVSSWPWMQTGKP